MRHYRPPLSVGQILAWADAHQARTGIWLKKTSGPVKVGYLGDNWLKIDHALKLGLRGLDGGSTLVWLFVEARGVRSQRYLPEMSEETELAWADRHRRRTGDWPDGLSGEARWDGTRAGWANPARRSFGQPVMAGAGAPREPAVVVGVAGFQAEQAALRRRGHRRLAFVGPRPDLGADGQRPARRPGLRPADPSDSTLTAGGDPRSRAVRDPTRMMPEAGRAAWTRPTRRSNERPEGIIRGKPWSMILFPTEG
jgi:hypothetical protein